MKINLNTVGLYLVLLLIALIPFHQEISKLFVYYREILSLLFIVLLVMHGSSDIFQSMLNRRVFFEILLLVLFPLIIIVTALVDPMVSLYGSDLSDSIMTRDADVNPKLYVFRNAVIYLPMVFYIAVRGLSPSDINKIAGVSALFAPLSVVTYMLGLGESSLVSHFEQLISGYTKVEYNSYVPYLTFSVLSIIYLLELNYKKYKLLIKMSLMSLLVFVFAFIFYSTSRQAMLLAIIYIAVFMAKNISVSRLKNAVYYLIFFITIYYSYEWITLNYGENNSLTSKLLDESMHQTRIRIWVHGLSMLDASEFFTGAGLTSVLVSGPHNDYVRWVQKVGLIFAFISFYPYFSAMFKSYIDVISYKKDRVNLYILCASLFIIYHSMFGYPREDAYQAIWCFLGISMWLGYHNYRRRKMLWRRINRIL